MKKYFKESHFRHDYKMTAKGTAQIYLLCRNQTWCIAGTVSHPNKYVEQ